MLVQSYGGEVLLRVLLYGMPFLAVLATEALRTLYRRRPRLLLLVLVVGLVLLAAATVTIRGGNDAYTSLRPSEIALTRQVLDAAPTGSRCCPCRAPPPRT